MHPASSVIIFTTFSGTGYGLFALMMFALLMGWMPSDAALMLTGLGISFTLVTIGLLSSTYHLGHPERAWRALSQWRTSWLSREGVMSIITYGPLSLMILLSFLNLPSGDMEAAGQAMASAVGEGAFDAPWIKAVAAFGIVSALITVYTTSMIYRSLKTIAHWHNGFVVPLYQLFAISAGAVVLTLLLAGFGEKIDYVGMIAFASLIFTMGMKMNYWRAMDNATPASTMETATGLGHLGKVSVLEDAHTEENYLMQEMGYRVGRKHATKLKTYYKVFSLIALAVVAGMTFWQLGGIALILVGGVSIILSLLAERWLFFAEAKHVVGLYYGRT